jgi:hypothetical protein
MLFLLSSCWAPRCPMGTCHVKYEHVHEGQVFRGGSFLSAKKHWPWDPKRKYFAPEGKEVEVTEQARKGKKGKKKKTKVKYKTIFETEENTGKQ